MNIWELTTRQLLSLASSIWFFSNLAFWLTLLILISPLKLIPSEALQRQLVTPIAHLCYRLAVRVNSFWMQQVVGIELKVEGTVPNHPNPVVVCNHQSWFDIPLVQELVSAKGPVLQFLIKRELIWVPIIGWICLVLNFPRLKRSGSETARDQDLSAITDAASALTEAPGALFIFAEGTRFSEAKRRRQDAPYPHLLRPKIGGLSAILAQAAPDTPVVDITLSYAAGTANFWRCLHGDTPVIHIHIETVKAKDIQDVGLWLDERWQQKSTWLHSKRHQYSS